MGIYQSATDLQNKTSGSPVNKVLAALKKQAFTIVILVIAVAVVVYCGYKWVNRPTATKQQTAAALNSAISTDTDTTIAKLKQAYDDAASADGKAQTAYYLAAHYSVKQDHKNALKYYREAEDFYQGKNIDVVLGVANEANTLSDKKLARDYYQKAIDYYKPQAKDNPVLQDLVKRLEAQIKLQQ